MDVDLLRPGSVRLSSDTILWFEFLLDQNLLLEHLQSSSDSVACELIKKFYSVISETLKYRTESENGDSAADTPPTNPTLPLEKPKHPAKNIALKILALKAISFLKWNLNKIRSLPFSTQIDLLQDVMYFTNDRIVAEIPHIEVSDVKSASPQFLFALIVYHRWLLVTAMHRITSNWLLKFSVNDITPTDENIICSPENVQKTINFLTDSLTFDQIPDMITFHCFKLPTESNDQIEYDWSQSHPISRAEYCSQINFDLGVFFFYKEQYDLAKESFQKCLESFSLVDQSEKGSGFCDLDKEMLDVYVRACSGKVGVYKGNLLEQLNSSIYNQYVGITNILQQDNIYREIPLSHRLNLELDIQGALSSGAFTVARDLLYKIKALNIVRCVLDRKPLYQYSSNSIKNIDTLISAIEVTWKSFSTTDQSVIKTYLLELVLKNEIPELLSKLQSNETFSNLFDKADLQYIRNAEYQVEIPTSLLSNGFTPLVDFTTKKRKPQLELSQLEQQLFLTYDHVEIRKILTKISKISGSIPVWNSNLHWELPIPLPSVVKSLPRGFLQDFAFVMLAKSREQMLNRNWNSSLELLIVLEKELQSGNGNVSKLFKLVSWEILLIKITQLLKDWPNNSIDKNALANACEACLQSFDTILPRTEINEHCVVCLLNLRRWEFLSTYDKRWSIFEVAVAIALACQEIVSYKGTKKLSKNLWDLVLPIFATTGSQSKRSNSNSQADVTNMKVNIMAIFKKLRDSMTLAVVISLLAKMFNILKDEASLELQVEYVNLWPAVVSNANSYNPTAVFEVLSEIVGQALKINPTNVPWLRLMGDINFANGHYKISLNYYLKSLLICNEYFNVAVRNDDHVFRRMIKCCTALGCHTQAAVLCQFLEEPDYALAFRILGEQKTWNDAVDAYYHCFWDTNILEYLIYIHNKKGEFQRRKCAIQVIGLLELNSNNNEEIQREASNLRKSTFLRALCKQYVF